MFKMCNKIDLFKNHIVKYNVWIVKIYDDIYEYYMSSNKMNKAI